MKRILSFGVFCLAAWLTLAGCMVGETLHDGDTVTPVLASGKVWRAGDTNPLKVRLQAHTAGANERTLDFVCVPSTAHPVATVTFFQGEQVLSTQSVDLTHRCCGGMYSAPGDGIATPSAATRAQVVIVPNLPNATLKQEKLETTFAIVQ